MICQNYAPITEKIVVEQVAIPYETVTKNTTGSEENTTNKVLQEGKDGLKEITYKIKYQNDNEIEKTVISEKVVTEPVNKIVQVTQKVTSRASTTARTSATVDTASKVSYSGGKWSYSTSEFDLLCAITAQECGSSYVGSDPLSQYKAKGQFCYTIDSHWKNKLGGNYSSAVSQAVTDALNGKRNHNYLSFRAANSGVAGQKIGGNVYF